MCSIVYTTARDREQAKIMVRDLMEKGLVACANVLDIHSIYRWNGEMAQEDEVGIILKTSDQRVQGLITRIEQIHPYETPCVISFNIDSGSKKFLDWVTAETS